MRHLSQYKGWVHADGYMDPYCSAELVAFDEMSAELEKHGVSVIALSKDTPDEAALHSERPVKMLWRDSFDACYAASGSPKNGFKTQ